MDDETLIESGGYYAILPAIVRHNRDLSSGAKLLYAEITALTNQRGYCYASNAYFQKLFDRTDRAIQGMLNELKKIGYITIADGSGGANERKIYTHVTHAPGYPPEKNFGGSRRKLRGSPEENFGQNIKDINNLPTNLPAGDQAKTKAVKRAPTWKPERFAGFWDFYPKSAHKNKQAAIKAWDQLRPEDELIDEIAKALQRQMATDQWQRGIGIPYPSTYLRQRRWEDEIEDPEEADPPDEGLPWI